MYNTPLLLALRSSARAHVSIRRRYEEEEERRNTARSATRADIRHCAPARYRLAPVLHGRTRGSLLERLVAKLRGRAPSSRLSLSRVSPCRAAERARAHHASSASLLSSLSPDHPLGTYSFRPLSCIPFSTLVSFSLSLWLVYLFLISLCLSCTRSSSSLFSSLTSTPFVHLPFPSLALSLSPPREEICRADSFSSRKLRHLRSRPCTP